MTTPLCTDCRHILLSPNAPQHSLCGHPAAITTPKRNLVTGKPGEPYQEHCSTMRLRHMVDNPCGPRGRYFEPAVPKGPPGFV